MHYFIKPRSHILLSMLLLLISLKSGAQGVSGQEQAVRRVGASLVQERVALHLDKPFYLAGEQLWFKVYLYGQDSVALSKVMYVEMLDADGKLVASQSHLLENQQAVGDFRLPGDLPSGYYQVKAYTAWMKNFSEGQQFHKEILVVNAKEWRKEKSQASTSSHALLDPMSQLSPNGQKDAVALKRQSATEPNLRLVLQRQKNNSLLVQMQGVIPSSSILIAEAGGKVFYNTMLQANENAKQVEVPLANVKGKHIRLFLLDNQGKVLAEERTEILGPQLLQAQVFTEKEQYQPREKVTVKLKLTNGQIGEGNAQLSMAVYADPERSWEDVLGEQQTNQDEGLWQAIEAGGNKKKYLKETEVFPLPEASGKEVKPIINQNLAICSPVKLSAAIHQEIDRLVAVQLIQESYDVRRYEKLYQPIPLQMDKTFRLYQYVDFESTESAIKEVATNLRLSKQKGKYQLRVLYTDQLTKYFFQKEPLYLIDGVIVKDIEEILRLDPKELESIQLAWRTETLSRNNLDQLVWNGIFSITTKGAVHRERLVKKGYQALFSHLAVPYTLQDAKVKEGSQQTLPQPDLRASLCWVPVLKTDKDGWATFTFTASDDLNTFRIAIMGMTEKGELVQAHQFFQVRIATPNSID